MFVCCQLSATVRAGGTHAHSDGRRIHLALQRVLALKHLLRLLAQLPRADAAHNHGLHGILGVVIEALALGDDGDVERAACDPRQPRVEVGPVRVLPSLKRLDFARGQVGAGEEGAQQRGGLDVADAVDEALQQRDAGRGEACQGESGEGAEGDAPLKPVAQEGGELVSAQLGKGTYVFVG